MQISHRHY